MPTTYLADTMWTEPEEIAMRERLSQVNSWNGRTANAGFPEDTILATEGGGPLMGIELEISTPHPDPCTFTLNTPIPFIYAKTDSSISAPGYGNRGYELVSVPADLAHQRMNWASIFKANKRTDIYRDAASTNGLHVHLGIDNTFDDFEHQRRFVAFFTANNPAQKAFLLAVSQREERMYNRYAGSLSYSFNDLKEMSSSSLTDTAVRGNASGGGDPCAVFTRYGTIEVRLFRGVWNFGSFLSSLAFVSEMVEWTRDNTWEHIFENETAPGRLFYEHVMENLDDTRDHRHLRAMMRAIQPCFAGEEQADILRDVEFCQQQRHDLSEGSRFRTQQGAEYAVRMLGEGIYCVSFEETNRSRARRGEGKPYVVRYRDDVFTSDGGDDTQLQEYLNFNRSNTTLSRIPELSDDELDAIVFVNE